MTRGAVRYIALFCVVSGVAIAAAAQSPAGLDRSGDARASIWRRYDAQGQLAEVDVDSNFDGSPDIEEYYERGALVRRESDRDFNGQADLVEEFDPDTHGRTRAVVDVDYDGTADLLVLFRDGRPVFTQSSCGLTERNVPQRHPSAVRPGHLTPLADPFQSQTAVGRTRFAPLEDGCVGVSTSGALPCPGARSLERLAPSAPLAADDARPFDSLRRLPRSPRAPPVS